MKKLFTLFAALVTVVAVNAQSVDYELVGFYDGTSLITELNLGMNEDLNPSVVIQNNGPDVPASGDTIFLDVSVNGTPFFALYLLGSQLSGLTAGQQGSLGSETPLLSADEMNEYGIEGSFQMCYTVRIVGAATDPVSSNNTTCLNVSRGTGIENIVAGEVSVYPNPANDVIYVANAEGAQVSVFDMNGRMVSSVESASANQAIDASSLAKGMYIVRIVDGQNVTTKKVSVVR